jgi:UDP-glucose 4-epimerase
MKVLVTGVGGFLGSHIAEHLIKLNHDVYGVDNFIGGEYNNCSYLPLEKLYPEDCCDLESMLIATKGIDVVYHCAATPHEGLSVFSPYVISKNNLLASVSVITAAIQNKVKRIIYCSSMARYGKQQTPFREDMETKPQDPYGISKVAGEEMLKTLCDTHGVEWVIAVPHNIIGPKQKYDDPFRNVVSIFLNRMMQNKAPIIYGDGGQTRCFSYVDDCISCLIKMLDSKEVVKQTINIGPDEEFVSIKEVAEICANVTGFNEPFIHMKDRPQEVKHAVCSSDKARSLLQYKTTTTLKEGINKTYQYIKKQGPRPFNYHLDLEIINDKTPTTWKDKLI